MEGEATTAMRIFVGGLGERVTDDDICKTFANLGSVQAVDIIRTKGRSFAYINFLPSSQNSLAKLFSMYNGCSWKGGKLKLEKAKEHFVDRLKREWVEDAELQKVAHSNHIEVDGNMATSAEPKSVVDLEKAQIYIFFPKLRKVKSLPLRGSGKHKYSFQRVEVPPFPVRMCDCCWEPSEVHIPREKLRRQIEVQDSGIQEGVVNEEEINLMESVMQKIINKASSRRGQHDPPDHPQLYNHMAGLPIDTDEIDDETDDDIKINTVLGLDDTPFLENWELPTNSFNEAATSSAQLTFEGLTTENKKPIQEKKFTSSNKRKSLSHKSSEKDISPLPKKKVRFQALSNESEVHLEDPHTFTECRSKKSSEKRMWSQKSAWKALIGDGPSSSFSVSQFTSMEESNNEGGPKPNNEKSTTCKKQKKIDNISHDKLPKGGDEPLKAHQPPELSTVEDKSTKGSSWSQKSSWTQLVGCQSSSSFSILQIVPTSMLKKQDLPKPISFGGISKEPQTSKTALGDSKLSKPSSLPGSKEKKDARACTSRDVEPSKPASDNHVSDRTAEKKSSLEPKNKSSSLPVFGLGVRISETCPFMRNSESLKRNNK